MALMRALANKEAGGQGVSCRHAYRHKGFALHAAYCPGAAGWQAHYQILSQKPSGTRARYTTITHPGVDLADHGIIFHTSWRRNVFGDEEAYQ